MNRENILKILKECNVILDGHFLLTSGKHSANYMQCAQLFQYPDASATLCGELVGKLGERKDQIDLVIGPAVGGIVMAYEMARQLGVRAIFAERENGVMTLRRGFSVKSGEKVLICEDVVTTGGSVKEVISMLEKAGAQILGVCSIVDRSKGNAGFGCKFDAVIDVDFETYEPDECPLCKGGSVAYKPGSRNI